MTSALQLRKIHFQKPLNMGIISSIKTYISFYNTHLLPGMNNRSTSLSDPMEDGHEDYLELISEFSQNDDPLYIYHYSSVQMRPFETIMGAWKNILHSNSRFEYHFWTICHQLRWWLQVNSLPIHRNVSIQGWRNSQFPFGPHPVTTVQREDRTRRNFQVLWNSILPHLPGPTIYKISHPQGVLRRRGLIEEDITCHFSSNIPPCWNIISAHTLKNIKVCDHGELKIISGISPHENKDSHKLKLRTYLSQCASTGVHMVLSMDTIFKWVIYRVGVKSSFLKPTSSERYFYVLTPSGSDHTKTYLWLLNSSDYGLVNMNER